jgi:hypothetical protein
MKKCTRCGRDESQVEFWFRNSKKHIKHSICTECMYKMQYGDKPKKKGRLQHIFDNAEKLKEWNQKNPFKESAYVKMLRGMMDGTGTERMNHASM